MLKQKKLLIPLMFMMVFLIPMATPVSGALYTDSLSLANKNGLQVRSFMEYTPNIYGYFYTTVTPKTTWHPTLWLADWNTVDFKGYQRIDGERQMLWRVLWRSEKLFGAYIDHDIYFYYDYDWDGYAELVWSHSHLDYAVISTSETFKITITSGGTVYFHVGSLLKWYGSYGNRIICDMNWIWLDDWSGNNNGVNWYVYGQYDPE